MDGFQVDLEAGANTIGVRVTAEDGTTTRTYTMVVTREASRVSADALASNLDEHFSKRFYVGNLEPGKTFGAPRRWDSKPAATKRGTSSPRSRSSSGRSRIRPACG